MGSENVRTWLLAAVATLAILSALYIAWPSPIRADGPTYVSGIISAPTTWAASGSPYVVTGNILVTRTVTLTVEPGVVVKFDGAYYLRVDGALKAIGTPSQPITFTSNKASPARGDWDSIRFSEGSASAIYDALGNYLDGSTLQYVTVEYGGSGDPAAAGATIQAYSEAAPFITGSTIRKSYGIYIHGGAARVVSNTVEENQGSQNMRGAIHVGGPARVLSNTVRNNIGSGGIYVDTGPALVAYNTVLSNTGGNEGGVNVRNGSATMLSNTISGNSSGGILLSWVITSTIVSNTISGNSGRGGISADGSSVSISRNAVSGNTAGSGWAGSGGGIHLGSGSSARVSNNVITGNQASLGYFANGGGILVEAGATAALEGNVVRNNVARGRGGGIYASGALTVTLNDISGNTAAAGGGLYLAGNPGLIFGNNITGNTPTALHNATSAQVSVPYNYWGTTDTSAIDAAIYDFYDDFDKGVVSYAPFLTAPISLPLRETFVPFVAQNRISGW